MKKLVTKITEGDGKLLDIKVPLRSDHSYTYSSDESFSTNSVKDKFSKIFDPKKEYFFMRTVGNRAADDLIRAHEKKILAKKGYDEDDDEHSYYFSANVHDAYVDVLKKQSKAQKIPMISYPLVESDCHSLDRHEDHAFWPTIHVIAELPGSNKETTKYCNLLLNLNSEESYKLLKRAQAPQNYQLEELELLHKNNIQPILTEPRSWRISADQLRNTLDFLLPFTYAIDDDNGPFHDDD